MKTPFSVEDLEKEIEQIKSDNPNYRLVEGLLTIRKEATLKERQRLKAEVEKILDEWGWNNLSDTKLKELKKRLFGK